MFVLADDLDYAAKIAENSGNPLDAKHMEYMSVCVDLEDCTQLSPVLALGDFSVFHSRKMIKTTDHPFCDGPLFDYVQKATTVIDAKISFRRVYTVARYPQKNKYTLLFGTL